MNVSVHASCSLAYLQRVNGCIYSVELVTYHTASMFTCVHAAG